MIKIDGRAKLKPHHIEELMETAGEHLIVLYYDKQNVATELILEKSVVLQTVFDEEMLSKLADNVVVTIATEDTILEVLPGDIEWHSKPARLKKLLVAGGLLQPAGSKVPEFEKTKVIAVGRICNDTNIIKDIEFITISNKKPKESLNWLNGHIENYQVRKQLDNLRIHVNYEDGKAVDPNGWLTVEQMIVKGYASK